jgi:hypothetical protein
MAFLFGNDLMLVDAILASTSIKSRHLAKWHSPGNIPKVAFQVVAAFLIAKQTCGTANRDKQGQHKNNTRAGNDCMSCVSHKLIASHCGVTSQRRH